MWYFMQWSYRLIQKKNPEYHLNLEEDYVMLIRLSLTVFLNIHDSSIETAHARSYKIQLAIRCLIAMGDNCKTFNSITAQINDCVDSLEPVENAQMTLTTKYGGGPDFAGATKACSDVQMIDNVPIKMCS